MSIGYAIGGPAHGRKLEAPGDHDHMMVPDYHEMVEVTRGADEAIEAPHPIRCFVYRFDRRGFWWAERQIDW